MLLKFVSHENKNTKRIRPSEIKYELIYYTNLLYCESTNTIVGLSFVIFLHVDLECFRYLDIGCERTSGNCYCFSED